ncbi:MAG: ABC transporter ATP-binding protein [Clostridia bacterium]|nr:ABC transporter ATP-binding protein [Clostridia bacterium]MBP5649250.1 ABC transporter ATP-binding protein [Clostridia bacterium]
MIKRVLSSLREYKLQSILTPLLIVIEVLMEVFIPRICADLVNFFEGVTVISDGIPVTTHTFALFELDLGYSVSTLTADSAWVVFTYAAILFVMAFISLASAIAAGRLCAVAACGFAKNLRKDVFYKIQDFSFENIDNFSTSSLITRLTTDITNIQNAFMMIIRAAVRSPLIFVFSLVMAFSINWLMGLLFVGAIILLGLVMVIIPITTIPIFTRIFKKYDRLNLRVQEDVRGARVIKSFVQENKEISKFNEASEDLRKDFTKAEIRMAFMMPVISLIVYILMGFVITLVSIMVVSTAEESQIVTIAGNLQIGAINSLIQYATMILMSMIMFTAIIVMVTMSMTSIKRVNEVLESNSSIISPKDAVNDVKDGSIDFENVSFSYSSDHERLAIKNINLSIKSGETIGVLGGTGSGKTTMVQLIPRLYDVTDGAIKVGGTDVRDYDIKSLRSSIAMVLQKNVLFSGTIKDNIRWGKKDATDEEIIAACKLAQADEFITKMPDGYDTYIEQDGTNVSGGQRQRLCIARAIVSKPKIIIFDDSTSAVDTKTDALIRHTMNNELPDSTKIIIAQRVASVEKSDKIVIIDGGEISAVGTHEELLKTSQIYREEYYSQNKISEKEVS